MKKLTDFCLLIVALSGAVTAVYTLLKWVLTKNVSWITLLSTLVITAVMFVFFYVYFFRPIKSSGTKLEAKITTGFQSLNNTTKEIFEAVREIQVTNGGSYLHPLSPRSASDWVVGNSPLVLNDSAKILVERSGIDKVVSENKNELIAELEKLNLKTAYDVQLKAFPQLGEFILDNPAIEKKIKDYVYNNPTIEGKDKPISFSDVVFVGSIELRDAYLDKYPKLKEDASEENPKQ
ncbi:MAG: hypothetical protein E6Q06_00055 [Candidatus Moraniibacteriota bacterium]|nr:MAG: hypothetical protein E6Q06_00055 [Candidatus Moranbacteria bacterium]